MPDIVTDPYAIAKAGCCVFTGDLHPIDYDGCWYDPQHWESDGYANAVRVTSIETERGGYPLVFVERIVILKREPKELEKALKSCGRVPNMPGDPIFTGTEIEAAMRYGHFDPDDGDPNAAHWSQVHLLVRDFDGKDPALEKAAKANHAILADEDDVWALINDWVANRSCA